MCEVFTAYLRIIPACAGSTEIVGNNVKCLGDHPRMRGEHEGRHEVASRGEGSSSHARGARWGGFPMPRVRRIIPACAGSTVRGTYPYCHPRDHPRMRGEHSVLPDLRSTMQGSSPHARGAPVSTADADKYYGIIPACAGSTQGPPVGLVDCEDHPRMRGEHLWLWLRLSR